MPSFLSDPSPTLYLAFTAVAVVMGVIAAQRQDRKSLIRFAIALLPLLLLFLIDRLVESPQEEATRKVKAMMRAANSRKPDDFVADLADTVEYRGAGSTKKITKEQLRTAGFWSLLHQFDVRLATWDYDVQEVDENTVEVGFLAKAEADGKAFPMYLRGTFTRQADGKFLLTRFSTFDPIKRTNEAITIPAPPFN